MKTRVIKIDPQDSITSSLTEAIDLLNSGGLVAFPTETVYGLAARADNPKALERLSVLKQRPDDKPFTLHIPDISTLTNYVPSVSLIDRYFLQKAWPGPLTVVFQLSKRQQQQISRKFPKNLISSLYHNNSIGIRLPDNSVARKLLAAIDGPVVAPSANLAGQNPPLCAEDVLEQLDGQIEMVIDSGPARYQRPSTIAKVSSDGNTLEIIRLGVMAPSDIQRLRQVTTLFVCTGNTCRSPMAQGIFKTKLAEILSCHIDQLDGKGYKVLSAGVMALSGAPATPEAVEVCHEIAVDIAGHKAQQLTVNLIQQADRIFVMAMSHYHAVVGMVAQAGSKTTLLADKTDIADPIGAGLEVYRDCANRISQAVTNRLKEDYK